jgi:Flp pilus assembly protein TadD
MTEAGMTIGKPIMGVMIAAIMGGGIAVNAFAADTPSKPSASAPDLTAVRAKIKAKEFKPAIADLTALVDGGTHHPDVYSLLGFSYRKSGDRTNGALYYRKALDLDPWHKGALEYQGEMFVEMGDLPRAKANLAKLVQLCPSGCEEREDLEKDIKEAEAKKRGRK